MRTNSIRTLAIAAALVALGGCAVYPNNPYYAGGGGAVIASSAPPPLYAESYGAPPYAGALWIGGYWGWEGSRHVWTPGRWEHARPGYHWVPRTWEQHGNQWHQRGGHWDHG